MHRSVSREQIRTLLQKLEEGASIDATYENGETLLHIIARYANTVSLANEERGVINLMKELLEGKLAEKRVFANPLITNKDGLTAFDLLNEEWKNKLKLTFLKSGFIKDAEDIKLTIQQLPPDDKTWLLAQACMQFSELIRNNRREGITNLKWLIHHLLDADDVNKNVIVSNDSNRNLFQIILATEPYDKDVSEIATRLKEEVKADDKLTENFTNQLYSEKEARLNLKEALDHYIKRIESDQKGNKADFTQGFTFFKKSQAANRKANYFLAQHLLNELSKPDISTKELFKKENIEAIRVMYKKNGNAEKSKDLDMIFKSARNNHKVDLSKLQKSEEEKLSISKIKKKSA